MNHLSNLRSVLCTCARALLVCAVCCPIRLVAQTSNLEALRDSQRALTDAAIGTDRASVVSQTAFVDREAFTKVKEAETPEAAETWPSTIHARARRSLASLAGWRSAGSRSAMASARRRASLAEMDRRPSSSSASSNRRAATWTRRSEIDPPNARKLTHPQPRSSSLSLQGLRRAGGKDAEDGSSPCYPSQSAGGRAERAVGGSAAGSEPQHGTQVPGGVGTGPGRESAATAASAGAGAVADRSAA